MLFTCNDGVQLSFIRAEPQGVPVKGSSLISAPIVLIHGWSASHRSFDKVIPILQKHSSQAIFAWDARFHGDSVDPSNDASSSHHYIFRLAMDLKNFLDEILEEGQKPLLVGTSLGAAVIWAYITLFTDASLFGCVFVDQAPCQWKLSDWEHCSKGIADEEGLGNIKKALFASMEEFGVGNAECCLTKPIDPNFDKILRAETCKCNPQDLYLLMRDHAMIDWRNTLPKISVPCLNCLGTESGCFPVLGTKEVSRLIGENCTTKEFVGLNHWLYIEDPIQFVDAVTSRFNPY